MLNKAVSARERDSLDMMLDVLDVRSAYLEATLDELIYIKLDAETTKLFVLSDKGGKFVRPNGQTICVLKKALYGLRQAGKVWYDSLCKHLVEYGLAKSKKDPALFTMGQGVDLLLVGLYVDDVTVVGRLEVREQFIDFVAKCFQKIKLQKNPREFTLLGMSFAYQRDGPLLVSQPGLEDEFVRNMGGLDDRMAMTPYRTTNNSTDRGEALGMERHTEFRSGVARLLYLASHTRPDVLTAVVYLTTRQLEPRVEDWLDLVHIAKYLRNAPHTPLRIARSDMILRGSADASHMAHDKSLGHTGMCLWFGEQNAPIVAKSKKQTLVAASTTESELIALYTCSVEISRMLGVCKDMELP